MRLDELRSSLGSSIHRLRRQLLLPHRQVVALKMQCPDEGAPFLEDPEGLGLAADINKYLPEEVSGPRAAPRTASRAMSAPVLSSLCCSR